MTGTVARFDAHAGYGTVRANGGGAGEGEGEAGTGDEYFFHCTAIADGSRTIDAGTAVTFDVVAGHNGRWEATGLRPG